jgi:hypothetical protein
MKHSFLTNTLTLICALAMASPLAARVFPGGGGGGGRVANPVAAAAVVNRTRDIRNGNYGDWGGGTTYQFNNTVVGNMPPRHDSGQNLLVQSGIRNTLTTQAQTRTAAIANQQQSTRDWWYQNQQQQSAARRTNPLALGQGMGVEPAEAPAEAAMNIIPWPALLQDRAFASRRALVEAPYRRSPPTLSTPTAKDYRDMITTVQDMKDVLEGLTREGVDMQEYNQAKAFLDKLQQEARESAGPNNTLSKPKS